MRLPFVSRARLDIAEAEIILLRQGIEIERNMYRALLQKQADDATAERRSTQERLIAVIDGQSALMVTVTQHLAKLDAPRPAAVTTSEPTLEGLAEQRATDEQVFRVREGLLREADSKGIPMAPSEAEEIARDMLSRSISG